jgi:hypothetical protein
MAEVWLKFGERNDIHDEEIFSDRKNGRLRRTPEERAVFSKSCSAQVRAAADAMYERFVELDIEPPFAADDSAWPDLADIALRTAAKVK